ncbi:3-oxoacyl-[acyl-carrier protein] reductase [Nonomuraea jiangxiensis]|uniref:3-oxoacyl-[acyl-carrier protein] reductase n=1 Tax=Nonomuraea jiangxiensis TaxID=633440 RepID=A0A1G8BVV9_9ACTN|nr:3-oxoacyl-[acyl-carrier protein] reductase [Nonomuraea jiangxiensis]
MVADVTEQLAPLRILVNNAGDYPRIAWADLTEDRWMAAIDLNLTGHYRCARAVTPAMSNIEVGVSSTSAASLLAAAAPVWPPTQRPKPGCTA